MNIKNKELYAEKLKKIHNMSDMLIGCRNRMCVTDDYDELFRMFAFLILYANDLYRLNKQRLALRQDAEDMDAIEKFFEEN